MVFCLYHILNDRTSYTGRVYRMTILFLKDTDNNPPLSENIY